MSEQRTEEKRSAVVRPPRRTALLLFAVAAIGLLASAGIDALVLPLIKGANVQLRQLICNLLYYLPFTALPLFLCLRKKSECLDALRPNPISLLDVVFAAALALMCVYPANDIDLLWCIPWQKAGFDVFASGFVAPATPRELVLCIIATAVLPAVCEEFLFRGAILSAFEEHGTKRAVLMTSALFMLLHGSFTGMPTQFLSGLVMSVLVIATDSIYSALIFHTVFNATTLTLQYMQRGTETETDLLKIIGGGSGVLMLTVEILFFGGMLALILRSFMMRAHFRGIRRVEEKEAPKLEKIEWICLITGMIAVAALYASDIVSML